MSTDPKADTRLAPRMPPSRVSASGKLSLFPDRSAVLKAAGAEVTADWAPLLADSFTTDETESVVNWLIDAIDRASRGADCPQADGSTALSRFLLERVNTALLRLLAEAPNMDKADVLLLMHGVDSARTSLAPDWDRYFASQISGPDGLNLVLEVAHDLRSPLTSIRCLAETLERGQSGPVNELQKRQLRLIYSASLGLGSLTTDVIEMARRGDQLLDDSPAPFSMHEMLESVAMLVRPIAEEKGLAFEYVSLHSDQRLGPPLALSRILLNLATNALKFTDEGQVELRARATTRDRVEFSIQDTGHGIPVAAIPDLYRPFRRSTGQGRSGYLFSGTGLGLALCRRLLRALGSDLHFETQVGRGTRFYFELNLPPVSRL